MALRFANMSDTKKIEKLFTLPEDLFNAVDFRETGLVNESTGSLPPFIKGEKYSLKGVSCDGFEMKEKIYELIDTIDTYGGVEIESVIVKQVAGESGTIFTLSKNDCDSIGIEYQQGLQLFPKSLPWVRVVEDVDFDSHNLSTTPTSIIDGTIRYVLLKIDGFKDYMDGYVLTPSGKLIKEELFEASVRVLAKEPVVYGNGAILRENKPLPIRIVKPNTSVFNHGNFISSDNEVFILIVLKSNITPEVTSFDGYFGVNPIYFNGLNPNEYFTIMWDEFGAKTIDEYKEEKERLRREHAEAVRREEERIKKEAERKRIEQEKIDRETEEAIKRMKGFKINTPEFPNPPVFKCDMDALASLDLYIDSLDIFFKNLDKEFSKINYDLSNIPNKFRGYKIKNYF